MGVNPLQKGFNNMRVSKAVKDYIKEQVEIKLAPKYKEQEAQARYETVVRDEILERASETARSAFQKVIMEEAADYPFLKANPDHAPSCYNGMALTIPDRVYTSSVHHWKHRMEQERDKIVANIVVELELGGNKSDLERLLSEI